MDSIGNNKQWIDDTWAKIDAKLQKVAVRSRNKLPYTAVDGVHNDYSEEKAQWWTNGFWGGMMWLMYKETGNEDYRITAETCEKLLSKVLKEYDLLDHDAGFMWHLTSGANYRITGNRDSRTTNLMLASFLMSRYVYSGDFIRAWNAESRSSWTIIDCMMNLALLYWASEEIGDDRFKQIAMRHADMALRDHVREDGSINHVVEHYRDKVGVVRVYGGQGYDETTCWSRGLSWAVYGFAISYVHTKEQRYLDAAKKCAKFFIEHCKETDYKPVIDFTGPQDPVYYDSTAGGCAACGMLEIAKYLDGAEAEYYMDGAIKILKAMTENFCDFDENTDNLTTHGSERYPLKSMNGVHIPIIYGDFFYVDAMLKLRESDFFIW